MADSLQDFLQSVRTAFARAGVPHMLAGSIASAAYGLIRATQDIDIVIDPSPVSLDRLLAEFPERDFYVSASAAHEALAKGGMFNIIPLDGLWKLDLIIRRMTPHGIEEFSRRRQIEVAGVLFDVATAEDTIIAKLSWAALSGSARQLEDVAGIVAAQQGLLDEPYLQRWIAALQLAELWRRAIAGILPR